MRPDPIVEFVLLLGGPIEQVIARGLEAEVLGVGIVEEEQEHRVVNAVPGERRQAEALFGHTEIERSVVEHDLGIGICPDPVEKRQRCAPVTVVARGVAPSEVIRAAPEHLYRHPHGLGRILGARCDAPGFKVDGDEGHDYLRTLPLRTSPVGAG